MFGLIIRAASWFAAGFLTYHFTNRWYERRTNAPKAICGGGR